MKNIIENVKANKARIIKKTLIIGGTAAGLLLTAALLKGRFADTTVGELDVVEVS